MASIGLRVGLLALIALVGAGIWALAPVLKPGASSLRADASSGAVTAIGWEDLLPEGAAGAEVPLANNLVADSFVAGSTAVSHEGPDAAQGGEAYMMQDSLDGERVALAGYMTPFSFSEDRVSEFLLVPYIGACVHVPPPPPNQIVLVESPSPVPLLAMWEPFTAVGTLDVETRSTDLAEVGYTMRLERMEAFQPRDDDAAAEPLELGMVR